MSVVPSTMWGVDSLSPVIAEGFLYVRLFCSGFRVLSVSSVMFARYRGTGNRQFCSSADSWPPVLFTSFAQKQITNSVVHGIIISTTTIVMTDEATVNSSYSMSPKSDA